MGNRIVVFIFVLIFSCLQCSCSGYRSTLLPRVTLTEEYTDNRELTNSSPKSDVISTITPGITYGLTGQSRALSLSLDPSFAYYANREESIGTRQAATVSAWDQLGRHSRLEVNDTFNRTDDPAPTREPTFVRTDEPSPSVDTTIRRSTEPYFTNDANANFRHDFGPSNTLYLGYTYSMLNNDDPTLENNTRQEPTFRLTYWLTPQYGIETRAVYTRGDFSIDRGTPSDSINDLYLSSRIMRRITPNFDVFAQYANTNVAYEGITPDYQIHDATIGVDYHLSRTVFFTLSGGYFWRTIDQGEPVSGYVARGDMAKEFSWGSVRLSGGTGYDQAIFGAENLGFTEFYSVTLAGTYNFTRHLSGQALVDYRHNTYNDAANREDTQTTVGAGLTYRFRPWLSTALRFTHHTVDSTVSADSYDENRVSLSVTLVPATPILLGH